MVYALDLDITPSGVPQIVKLSQYDKTMPQLVINLYNGAQPFTIPTGCTAYIEGTKADKTGFQYTCAITNNVITADITEQMTAFAGRVACEVVLRKSGERKGSANFFLDIEPAALSDDTVVSDSDLPILQQIPETLAECENYADLAHKWATFGSDSEEPSATNNSKYWAEKSQEYAVGALHWKGSIEFANIPTSGMVTGDLYNITDDFTTDNRFTEGAGIECPAGTDIVWGANGKWDLPLSATNATQVKYGNTTVAAELNQINTSLTDINADLSDILNKVYPIGCIIKSTTCSTLALVKASYGGNNWVQHTGYMLRGATSGVTANQAQKDGGSDSHTLLETELPSHSHVIPALRGELDNTDVKINYGNAGSGVASISGSVVYLNSSVSGQATNIGSVQSKYLSTYANTTGSTGGGTAFSTVPNYKNVYIWERVS